jgi:tRNA threonylcarbamoyladenosine modification (KEOPS) complex Cgi121 subunit
MDNFKIVIDGENTAPYAHLLKELGDAIRSKNVDKIRQLDKELEKHGFQKTAEEILQRLEQENGDAK